MAVYIYPAKAESGNQKPAREDPVVKTVADPEISERTPRNMTYKPPHSVTILFMNIFCRLGEGCPPGSATGKVCVRGGVGLAEISL